MNNMKDINEMNEMNEMNDMNKKVIQFKNFIETGLVHHGFSTKHGGVSVGSYASMNLGLNRGDDPGSVMKNYHRFCERIGVSIDSLVLSDQVHENKVVEVGIKDVGKGILKASDLNGIDGLMTKEAGVTLTTFYADCVPLYFLDPLNKAIALSHAGWRGTVKGIGKETVRAMQKAFGTKAESLLIGIGPSIHSCCYEVSEDVINEFEKEWNRDIIDEIAIKKDNGKFMLDLQRANKMILMLSGVLETNIETSQLCTMCEKDDFFSHRILGYNRGSMAAMLALKAL